MEEENDNEFYLTPDEDFEEWELEPDSPELLARDLAAIALLEQSTITPLHVDLLNLPNDVISQIFYHACQPIPGDEEWRRPFYPLWFGRLCRTWREIAWATSELWTTVVVRALHHGETSKYEFKTQADLLQEWLQRAKGRKLNIYFGEAKENQAVNLPFSLMQLIFGKSEQWQDVHFHLSKNWGSILHLVPIPPKSHLPLPNLRSIVVQQPGIQSSQIGMLDLSLAPSLRSIGLSGLPISVGDVVKSFPCSQITQLTLTMNSIIELRDLLPHFPRLQSAYFVDTPYLRIRRNTNHQGLESLSIRSSRYEWNGYSAFGRYMDLPALKSLEIVQPGPIEYTRHLLPFFMRSKCSLTSLTLECLLCVEYDLIDFLFSLDSLSELHIRNSENLVPKYQDLDADTLGLGRTFFDVLHEDAPFLPNLEVFSYKGPLAVQAIDFIEPFIIRSRMRGAQVADLNEVALLKKATIIADQYSEVAEFSIAEYSDPQYIWELVRMVEEGVLVLRNMDGSSWS